MFRRRIEEDWGESRRKRHERKHRTPDYFCRNRSRKSRNLWAKNCTKTTINCTTTTNVSDTCVSSKKWPQVSCMRFRCLFALLVLSYSSALSFGVLRFSCRLSEQSCSLSSFILLLFSCSNSLPLLSEEETRHKTSRCFHWLIALLRCLSSSIRPHQSSSSSH